MIPELGHYALVLALALGLIQAITPIVGARGNDAALMGLANVADAVCFCRLGISGVDRLLRDLGFLGCDSLRKCTFDDAANLQGHKRLGKPRRLDALVGSDTVLFRGIGWRIRKQLACNTQSVLRIGSAIVDRLRFLLVHPLHFQPFLASGAGPLRGA
jgi:hypothetical protein